MQFFVGVVVFLVLYMPEELNVEIPGKGVASYLHPKYFLFSDKSFAKLETADILPVAIGIFCEFVTNKIKHRPLAVYTINYHRKCSNFLLL